MRRKVKQISLLPGIVQGKSSTDGEVIPPRY
jgi:hypothetical protein